MSAKDIIVHGVDIFAACAANCVWRWRRRRTRPAAIATMSGSRRFSTTIANRRRSAETADAATSSSAVARWGRLWSAAAIAVIDTTATATIARL
jgi:hypothetical protein